MVHTTRITHGDATVEIDDTVEEAMDTLLGGLPGQIRRRFEAHAERVWREAKPYWPVKTGRSRDGWFIRSGLDEDGIKTVLANRVDYAFKIRFSMYTKDELDEAFPYPSQRSIRMRRFGTGAPKDAWIGKNAASKLIKGPAKRQARGLDAEIERELERLAKGK